MTASVTESKTQNVDIFINCDPYSTIYIKTKTKTKILAFAVTGENKIQTLKLHISDSGTSRPQPSGFTFLLL